jgi:hypothetical protein
MALCEGIAGSPGISPLAIPGCLDRAAEDAYARCVPILDTSV